MSETKPRTRGEARSSSTARIRSATTALPTGTLLSLAVAALVAGSLALLRLSALAALASLGLALPARTWRWILFFAAPGVLALAIFQFSTFGSPLRTGYDYWLPNLKTFDVGYVLQRPMGDGPTMVGDALDARLLSWLCPCTDDGPLAALPNALFYPAVVLGPFWIFTPPFTGLLGLLYAIRCWRRDPAARYAIWLTVTTCVMLSVYVFQAARLAAAPAALLAIFGAVAVARGLEHTVAARWSHRLRFKVHRPLPPPVRVPDAPPPAGVA